MGLIFSVCACFRITPYDQFPHIFFPSDGIARTTPSPGTNWSPPISTRCELLSTLCTNDLFHTSLCSLLVAFKMKRVFLRRTNHISTLIMSQSPAHTLALTLYACLCVCAFPAFQSEHGLQQAEEGQARFLSRRRPCRQV